jgi:hypothetical protein
MHRVLAPNKPDTTLQLLNKLDLAIDEARLVRKIMDITNQVANIESTIGPSIRTQRLREEIKILENQLSFIRNQKSLASQEQGVI